MDKLEEKIGGRGEDRRVDWKHRWQLGNKEEPVSLVDRMIICNHKRCSYRWCVWGTIIRASLLSKVVDQNDGEDTTMG
jgi:hypothetical protein